MKCVVAGSYRKFYSDIRDNVIPVFEQAGIEVQYPPKSVIVNPDDPYPIFESDDKLQRDPYSSEVLPITRDLVEVMAETRNVPIEQIEREIMLEQGFMEAAVNADFVYLFNPRGYMGQHTTFEMGFLLNNGKPIYSLEKPEIVHGGLDMTHAAFTISMIRSKGGVYAPEELVKHLEDSGKLCSRNGKVINS